MTSSSGLTLGALADGFALVSQFDIPVANVVLHALQTRDIRVWTNRQFDPVTQRELLKTGYIGKILPMQNVAICGELSPSKSLPIMGKNETLETIRRKDRTRAFWYLVGVYLGDGFIKQRNNSFGIRSIDRDFVEAVRTAYITVTNSTTRAGIQIEKPGKHSKKAVYTFEVTTKRFCTALKRITRKKERLPLVFDYRTKPLVEGLLDSEGWVDYRDAGKGSFSWTCGFVTTSLWAPQFRSQCEFLGMIAGKPLHGVTKAGTGWTRYRFNMASVVRSEITFRVGRKQQCLNAYKARLQNPQRLNATAHRSKIKSDLHGDMQSNAEMTLHTSPEVLTSLDIWGAQVRESRRQTPGTINTLGDPQYLGVMSVRIDLSHMDGNKRPCKTELYAGTLKQGHWSLAKEISREVFGNKTPSTTSIAMHNLDDIQPELAQLILGSLFGDASLSTPRSETQNVYLEESHCIAQREYLLWKKGLFERYGVPCSYNERELFHKPTGKTLQRCTLATKSLPLFKQVRKQFYTKGEKLVQRTLLNKLDEFGLAIWFMDDGHLSVYANRESGAGHRNAYLHTESYGVAGNKIIQKWFSERFGVNARLWKDNKGYWLLRIPSLDFQKLLPLLTPYIHPTLTYKIDMKFKRNRPVAIHNARYAQLVNVCNDIV